MGDNPVSINVQTGRSSNVLDGHYDRFKKQQEQLELRHIKEMNPIKNLDNKIEQVKARMNEAQEIFSRKFNLIHDQVNCMLEKIEEDKQFQQEMILLRQQEIDMITRETESFFGSESSLRKELEVNLS